MEPLKSKTRITEGVSGKWNYQILKVDVETKLTLMNKYEVFIETE